MINIHARSVAQERVAALSQSEEADLARRREGLVSTGGWTGVQTTSRGADGGDGSRTAPPPNKTDAISRLERRLEVHLGRGKGWGAAAGVESTARVTRTIQFLEDCDR